MIEVYRKVLSLFDARERRQFWLLTGFMVLVAFAEVLGISTVLVLLNVLAAPETIADSRVLAWAYERLGFETIFGFQVALSGAVFLAVLASLVIKALGTYAITRFSALRGYTISTRLLAAYLGRPYAWFLVHNSAEIGKTVLSEVDALVNRVVVPSLKLLSNMMIATAIIGFLVFVDPLISVLAAGFLGGSYALIYLKMRDRLRHSGEVMRRALGVRFRVANEATGGIKDIKLMGLEEKFLTRYAGAARLSARYLARIQLMGELPRFALEAITFATLLGMVLVLLLRSGGTIADIIPTLGIFAFSVMRLLPALQQTYFGLSSMRSGVPILEGIAADYAPGPVPGPVSGPVPGTNDGTGAGPGAGAGAGAGAGTGRRGPEPLRLERELELTGVRFRYDSAAGPALTGLDLAIPARTTVGIVGGTGAGKTTLVDLILGLLSPDEGEIRVDGTPVTPANLRAWQQTLGYVPQAIYLTDDTIAANIAFGVPPDQVDREAMERAARAAALHDFVVTELPQGYDTVAGERGVRLSGGQRQRIGIARALYRTPSLLIMDEATSALDGITEDGVMQAIRALAGGKTIILVAHRITTLRECDVIYMFEQGVIADSGTYPELMKRNAQFRAMASSGRSVALLA
jgi:ATP-binding cassette, subfamily B, bacterial PglK